MPAHGPPKRGHFSAILSGCLYSDDSLGSTDLYSDDGLGSTDNSALWNLFMVDFKVAFNVLKKDPDYFFGCAIEWDPITGIIKLDPGQYLREIVAKYDMTDIHSSPIPLPAGRKISP